MRVFRRLSVGSSVTTTVIALAILSAAQTGQSEKTSKVQIKNFGCVDQRLYRGAQPKDKDYADLAAMGIKTVIDLQKDGESREQALVEAQGMKFYRIGMSDKSQPGAEQVDLFLKLVNEPANHPIFIHCHGGRHRTGTMTAIYRMTHYGWSADQAFQEMKQFDFEYGIGHGPLKRYVYDCYSRIEQKGLVVSTSPNK